MEAASTPRLCRRSPSTCTKAARTLVFPRGRGSPVPSSSGAYSAPLDPWLWGGPAWCSTKAILRGKQSSSAQGPALSLLRPFLLHLLSPPQSSFSTYFLPIFLAPGRRRHCPRETNSAAWGQEYSKWCQGFEFRCWSCYFNSYVAWASHLVTSQLGFINCILGAIQPTSWGGCEL